MAMLYWSEPLPLQLLEPAWTTRAWESPAWALAVESRARSGESGHPDTRDKLHGPHPRV